MTGGLLALGIAAIGAAYAILVIRAAPTRRDNLMFGALALTDAAMTAWRGFNVLSGDSIVNSAVILPCAVLTIGLAVLTIDFIASFPRRRAMSWRWRALLLAWGGGAVAILLTHRADVAWSRTATEWMFFAPATLLVLLLGGVAWRRTRTDRSADRAAANGARDARTVIAMLWFRWIFGFAAYYLAPMLGIWEQAVWAETTFATLVSFVVIGTAVLRSDLFSIRSAAAEAVTIATIALGVALGGGVAVLATLHYTEPGNLQTALLVGSTLVPLALAAIGRAMYPRLEANVLAPLDERRARRLAVQGEPLPAALDAAIAEAVRRIASIADGATVSWRPAAQLSPRLVDALRTGEPQRSDVLPDLPACFVVPALGAASSAQGEQSLVGAVLVSGGRIDRDTYLVARELAARIALVVERAHAVSELEDARRLAALGQFAAAIAHDIRTPLTSISLNVQILRRRLELTDDDREHFDIALEELARLDKSVAEILDFAKPVRLAPEAIDVAELLETTTRGLSPVLSERGIALRCERGGELPTVHGDPQRLRQVIVNLIGNAAEASSPGAEVTVRASIHEPRDAPPAATEPHRAIAIEVEDRGRGIHDDDLPRIFEPFLTTRPDGTGLGLAICHKVVRAHGGDIRVRSAPGAGSTFTVVLPAA